MRDVLRCFCLLMVLSLATVLFPGCNDSDDDGGGNDGALKIGVLLPMTGSLSGLSRAAAAVRDQALSDLTLHFSRQGVTRPLRLKTLDTASDPATAAAQAKVLADEGFRIIVGPFGSAECEEVLPLAAERGLVLISPSSTSKSLAIPGDNLYRLILSDENQGKALAVYLQARGVEIVVPVVRGDLYGQGLTEDLETEFAALGGQVAASLEYDPADLDPAALASAVSAGVASAAGRVEGGIAATAVVLIAYDESAGILAACAGETQLGQAIWTGSDGTARNAAILDNQAAAAFARQVGFTALTFSRDTEAQPRPGLVLADMVLREDIRSRESGGNEFLTLGVWDAVWLAGYALHEAGPKPDAAALKSSVASVAGTFVGLNGMLRLNEAGDLRYGDYGFYTVGEKDGAEAWRISAAYHFDGGGESFAFVSPRIDPGKNPPSASHTIGALLPTTGAVGESGRAVRAGLEEALGAINQHLALHGYPVTVALEVKDTASDPDSARSALEELSGRGIDQFIGPVTSAEAAAALPEAQALDALLVSPASTAVSLAVSDDNLYRFVPSDVNQAEALATLMWNEGVRTFAAACRDDAWGRELAQGVSEAFARLGGATAGMTTYDPAALDVNATLLSLNEQVAAGGTAAGYEATAALLLGFDEGVDLLAVAGSFPALGQVRWFGADGLARSERLAKDKYAAAFAADRQFTASIYTLQGGSELVKKSWPRQVMFDRIAARLGTEPVAYAHSAWDALWVLVFGILEQDWQTGAAVLGPGLMAAAPGYIGLGNYMRLDDNGDKLYGDYGFYRLAASGGSPAWSLFATYHFHPGFLPPAITYP